MKEPSENDIKKEKQSELDKIADMNAKCVAGYLVIRNTIFNGIEDADLVKMNKYITVEYGKVYTGLKGMIIDALNDAKDKNVKLVEKLLDTSLPAAKHYEVLPKTAPFKYTNRVFTQKSVSLRSQKAADTITKIIADGRNDGLAIKDIQKKIDTVMGFRDAQGKLTDKSKKLIESGRFAHKNGSIYETYRIARTETMRMNAFVKYDEFLELRKTYPNTRLKLKSTLDGRERQQSKDMDGQVSNADGEFLYPDGKFYRLGEAPAQWCINDREVQYIVFLSETEQREAARNINREDAQFFKEIDNQSIQDVAEIQEVKEIENKIKEIGAFRGDVNLEGMPIELAKEVYSTSNKVFARYPQLKNQYELILSSQVSSDNFADNLSSIGSIRLNSAYFTNIKLLQKEYNYAVEMNVHPKNTNYNALLLHEYGHSLGEYLEKEKGLTRLKVRNIILDRTGYKVSDITEKLSISAKTTASEFIAEAFAEYLNSPKPRKIAKEFGKFLSEILN